MEMYVVSPIVNGCSQESLYTGSLKDCKAYVAAERAVNPKADFIITQDWL